MRVYVAACGLGLGHISRSTPIVEELLSRGVEVVVSTYLDGLDYAKARGFKVVETVPIGFRVKNDGTVDFKQTAARSGLSIGLRRFLKQVTAEIRNIKRFRPDIVFSDSRASSIVAARLLGIPVILMLNQFRIEVVRRPSSGNLSLMDRLFFLITNIFWNFVRTLIAGVWAQSELILIPDFPYPYTISLGNLAIPRRYKGRVRFVGPVVHKSPRDLPSKDVIVKEFSLSEDKPKVYAAVSGPRVERRYLGDTLCKIFQSMPQEYEFILSRGNPRGDTKPTRNSNVLTYEWLDDEAQFKILKAADIVIGRSGHGIIMKALTFGKPLILIPTPDHTEQYGNARRAVQLGVAIMLDQSGLNKENLSRSIVGILSSLEFKTRAEGLSSVWPRHSSVGVATDSILSLAETNR